MLFKGAAFGEEKAFMTIKASPGIAQSITTGYPVQLATASASFDGTQAVVSVGGTGTGGAWIGHAYKDIGANQYGTIQIFGPTASVLLSNAGSSVTINLGDPLIPSPAGYYSGNPLYGVAGFNYILASNLPVGSAVSAAAYCTGFIRCIK